MKPIDVNINSIRCKLYLSDKDCEIKKMMIICSGMRTKNSQVVIKDIINKKSIFEEFSVISFSLLEKDRFNNLREKLTLYKCIEKIENIYLFLNEKYPNCDIYFFTFGFASYATLLSIDKFDFKLKAIYMYNPLINMSYAFKNIIKRETLIDFDQIKVKKIKSQSQIEEINDFYSELKSNDILKINFNKVNNIVVLYDLVYKDIFLQDCKKMQSNKMNFVKYDINDLCVFNHTGNEEI